MTKQEEVTPSGEQGEKPKFTPLHVNAHGYDTHYIVRAFIEDESDRPVCGLYEGDGPYARLFAAAPALYEALKELLNYGVEFDDSRMTYVVAQVDRESIADAKAALALVDGPQETK